MKRIPRWLLPLSALLLAAGCGPSAGESTRLDFDDVSLSVTPDPGTPRVGDNALLIELRDGEGDPIEAAQVAVQVRMPAMGAMAAMGGPAGMKSIGGGRYRADFELAMGSTWQVEIDARAGDAPPIRAEGSLTVGTPGLRLEAIRPRSAEASHTHDAHDASRPAAPSEKPHPGEITLSQERLQRVGVTTTVVETKSLPSRLRVVGRVVAPESDQVDVSLKIGGWAAKVQADAVGVAVRRGDLLFEVDSPELLAAEHEYVEALRSQSHAHDTSFPDRADGLVDGARSRLRLWGVDSDELDRLTRTREAAATVPIRAPITGWIIEKNLVQGGAFAAGERLYRIVPLSRVWVEAEIYEADLARVRVGQQATITLAHDPSRAFEAPITLLQPSVEVDSRSLRVRLEVANPDLVLRPNMFANVEIEMPEAASLVVPQSAVVQAGTRSFVFRALGEGRFRPQAVELGRRFGEEIEIRSGLAAGDSIVRSGTFLVAAESRLRAALEHW